MKLAFTGGKAIFSSQPLAYKWFSDSDLDDLESLIRSQKLSGFLAQHGNSYLGGYHVIQLEKIFKDTHNVSHSVSFNSWTSGLEAIFVALDLGGEDEIIVTPWTMSGTVAAIALSGAKPVFCDISLDTFNIDPAQVASLISSNTKAICGVDIFGRPADWLELKSIANSNDLYLVADSAQAPGAKIDGVSPSAIADVGGFSLNRHKHVQSGEGGVAITNNSRIAEVLQALRNHGEVANPSIVLNQRNLIGHNWRLGEIEALLAGSQMKNLEMHLLARRQAAYQISEALRGLEGLNIPKVPINYVHDYYILGMHFDENAVGVPRNTILAALKAEGVDFAIGEYCDLQKIPVFSNFRTGDLTNTEFLNKRGFLGLYLCGYEFNQNLIDLTLAAFEKVWAHRNELQNL